MKLIYSDEKGKEHPYKFKDGEDKQKHLDICYAAFGAVPYDVNWTKNNPIYKEKQHGTD